MADKKDKYDNYLSHNYKKIAKFLNKYQKMKSFLTDPRGIDKKTFYERIDAFLANRVYLEGYFESEKYFFDLKSKLIDEPIHAHLIISFLLSEINTPKNCEVIKIKVNK